MSDLVPGGGDCSCEGGPRLGAVARHEPGGGDVVIRQELEDPFDRYSGAVLPSADRLRRESAERSEPGRQPVEVYGHADSVLLARRHLYGHSLASPRSG